MSRPASFLYGCGLTLFGAVQGALAQTVTIPNAFTAGTPAKAEQVNANFSAVANAVNSGAQNIAALQTTVTTIQSTPAGAVVVSVAGVNIVCSHLQ
jgi:hypothetical protein